MNLGRRISSLPLGNLGALLEAGSTFRCSPTQQLPRLAAFLSTTSTPFSSSPLHSTCVLERLPVVMPSPPAWETDYENFRAELVARRLKTLPKELIEEKKGGEDQSSGSTAKWQPAPLETPADKSGDRTTTRRRLDQRIFMLVKRKDTGAWELPHAALQPGETTRAGAERALQETLGSEGFQPYFVGNSPAGHVELESVGAFFFHRCQLINGKPKVGGEWSEVAWAAKDELEDYIKDEKTLELLQKML